MTVRQFKIHTNFQEMDNKTYDVTNGPVRLYLPSNLGIDKSNNIYQSNGIGILGTQTLAQPEIEFTLLTFGADLKENYQLITEFGQDLTARKYVTLEYQTESFQVFADVALKSLTKTEGFDHNGRFEETITFEVITKWYVYETLEFKTIKNGTVSGVSKIYGGTSVTAPTRYTYQRNKSYTYYGETNIERLSQWRIDSEVFSIKCDLAPNTGVSGSYLDYGLVFYDEVGNEYTAILFNLDQPPSQILINTDVNNEYYQSIVGSDSVNIFPSINFERYRTRFLKKGRMDIQNLVGVSIQVKRKVDFI